MKSVALLAAALAALASIPLHAQEDDDFTAEFIAVAGKALDQPRCREKCVISIGGERLSVHRAHLTDAPIPQYIVPAPGEETCGTAGCQEGVLAKRNGRWGLITAGFRMFALATKTNGFHDLMIGYKGPGFEFQGPFTRLIWNGTAYVERGAVALKRGQKPVGFDVD